MESEERINEMLIQLESIRMDKKIKAGWQAALHWVKGTFTGGSDKHEK